MPADARVRPPHAVLITGASAGLGAALALEYAAPGRTLVLVARRPAPLQAIADRSRAAGARVITAALDVRDALAFAAFVQQLEQQDDAPIAIDLAIVNAGLFSGRAGDSSAGDSVEPAAAAAEVLSVNLSGAIATVAAVLPGMRRRRAGRIALITSLAALQPLADAPAYSASKAGLAAYGEALRELLAPDGIAVSIVYPGHIATAQATIHVGQLPLLMSADAAARRMRSGLDAGRSAIAFPRLLLWLIRAGRLLPWPLRALLGRSQRFTVRPGTERSLTAR